MSLLVVSFRLVPFQWVFLPGVFFYSLAIGSPLSELATFAQKVAAINSKHGPFAACVVSGDVFKAGSDGSELEGVSCELC